eukprot:scaffold54252_cov35-Prasinocladus_malaysianus.AAC.3
MSEASGSICSLDAAVAVAPDGWTALDGGDQTAEKERRSGRQPRTADRSQEMLPEDRWQTWPPKIFCNN